MKSVRFPIRDAVVQMSGSMFRRVMPPCDEARPNIFVQELRWLENVRVPSRFSVNEELRLKFSKR